MVGVKVFSLLLAGAVAGCAPHARPETASQPNDVQLIAEIVLPSHSASPTDLRFGGLSGLASLRDGHELLAISDDPNHSRIERLQIVPSPAWRIDRLGTIRLEPGGAAPPVLDPEGIALTAEGRILISSEGAGAQEPRVPPSINEYSPDGRFIRSFTVRDRFAPNEAGPLVTGVRNNAGFESLTLSPDHERLFTAAELPLAQDGEADPFAAPTSTRVLEYTRRFGAYEPAREFAYEISALDRPSFAVGFAVNGLVELLALSRTELIALERGYVESADRSSSANRIRIFHVDLARASDISRTNSLREAPDVRAVRKTLIADLDALPGLSPALRRLDNFEGLAWGPPGPDGQRPLLLVSDDNFNPRQLTAILALRLKGSQRLFR